MAAKFSIVSGDLLSAGHPPEHIHGGSLDWAEAKFGRPKAGWVDLSTGINPKAYPFQVPPEAAWRRLPDALEINKLKQAAADRYKVSDPSLIVPAPGSQSLIQLLPRLRGASHVEVLSPTYSEHAVAWRAESHSVFEIADIDMLACDASVVVVTNPNNPDGRVISPDVLLKVADQMSSRGGWLVVDEAFSDTLPETSLASYTGRDGLIVLRSFGKFYGLAGLRLGFALAPSNLALEISTKLGPWPVSGPAIAIAVDALSDDSWHTKAHQLLEVSATRLDRLLYKAGLSVIGGTPLFRLVIDERAHVVFEALGREGILVRHFPENRKWLRIGIPENETAFARLEEALTGFC